MPRDQFAALRPPPGCRTPHHLTERQPIPEISPSRYLIQAGWDDVPHLDEKTKRELLVGSAPFLRDARSKGIPSLGAGAIYPIELAEIEVKPFAIPAHWKKGYALDVGWNRTAALWGAQDPSDSTIYLYAEHYRGMAEPVIHASAIKARGEWIRGCIDPASRGRQQMDGKQLLAAYQGQGLHLVPAINGVETGLYNCWEKLSIGRVKVFSTLQNFKAEYSLYRRDDNGAVVKKFDHLMDCFRYLIATWGTIASVQIERRPSGSSAISDREAGY